MSVKVTGWDQFNGGLSDFDADSSVPNAYYFGQSVDVRTNPRQFTLLPRTIKESGSVITDLPKWLETYDPTLISYIYGNTGNLYSRTLAGSYTFLRQVANSHGNGEVYSAEDGYLYYASDKVIGRSGPLSSASPTFVDDYFGSQGGVPLNTNSLQLIAASSQSADAADSGTLSITGDLSLSEQINPATLPAVGATQVYASKWNIQGNQRSYMLDITGVSGYFGDGSDGSLTISSNTTEVPIDSACTGTSAATSLSATNASFATGQIILIHQTQGTGAGSWMRNTISSYTAGTITLGTALNTNYVSGAQVRVQKQYTSITINSGFTWTAKAWNGTVGGILANLCSGTVTGAGNISGAGKGFRGGTVITGADSGADGQGEGNVGAGDTQSHNANGSGGGGGGHQSGESISGGGGGGGNGTAGLDSGTGITQDGKGGTTTGSTDLTSALLGGGGGAGGKLAGGAIGGAGGGFLFLTSVGWTLTGTTSANGVVGAAGTGGSSDLGGGGGGGAGGSILLKVQTATLGAGLITATKGTGGTGNSGAHAGGDGGDGRIHIDYYTSYTGTTSPTIDPTQDNSLVTNTSYQMRLSLSSNGTNSEALAMVFTPTVSTWQQIGVSWKASTSTASFYLGAVLLGTRVGTFTSIFDSTAKFAIGASYDAGGATTNFYNGLVDEVQVYSMTQTQAQFFAASTAQVSTTAAGLQAYYKLNASTTDATGHGNTLTLRNSPTYSTNVPFSSPTTRLDIDQSATTTGDTYAVPVAISEASTDRKTFTPAKDPQKSAAVLVAAKGTGNWTITVHDSNNNVIATSTITNANMTTGYVEFFWTAPWSPLTNFTSAYHFHITSTVADGTVTTTTHDDLETVSFRTYFQFLITDNEWHPMTRMLQFWVVGNGQYIGKYEATLYDPNLISLGAGWRIRCFGKWGEYLVAGVFKGANIYDLDQGKLFFWDGIAPTFNYSVEIPEGGINALLGVRNKLYIWAGYQNQLLEYTGGLIATKIKDLPLMESTSYSSVYPQGVTMWRSLLRYAVSGLSNSTAIQRGVYTWGSTNIHYPEILTYDYPLSTGNLGSTVSVSLVAVVNQRLLIGWQDGTGFGMDYVSTSNPPFPSGYMSFLVDNEGESWKEKDAIEIDANCNALASGESISTSYLLENSVTPVTNPDSTTTGDKLLKQIVENGRYYNMNVTVSLATSNGSTAPTVQSCILVSNLNEAEQRYG